MSVPNQPSFDVSDRLAELMGQGTTAADLHKLLGYNEIERVLPLGVTVDTSTLERTIALHRLHADALVPSGHIQRAYESVPVFDGDINKFIHDRMIEARTQVDRVPPAFYIDERPRKPTGSLQQQLQQTLRQAKRPAKKRAKKKGKR